MLSFYEFIKKTTAVVLIISLVLLVFLAILSIWEVLDGDFLYKSLSSMFILSISSALLIFTSKIGLNERSIAGVNGWYGVFGGGNSFVYYLCDIFYKFGLGEVIL